MYGTLVRLVLGAVVAAGVLAGCADDPGRGDDVARDSAAATTWFQPCPAPPASPATGSAPSRSDRPRAPGTPPVAGAGSVSPMPAVSLPCIRQGDDVDLAAPLGVPTVVNVWASWCRPCREELPVFQAYAERADGKVQVLGVVSGDTRDAATSLARELDVRFPTLYDDKAALMKSLGRTALPVTLFIDAEGRLAHLYNGRPLTGKSLAALVERHLGVAA